LGELSENGYGSRIRRFLPIRRASTEKAPGRSIASAAPICTDLNGIVVRFAALPDIEDLSSETATVNRPCARPEHGHAGAQRGY
jgi:hypothetical protein